MDWKAANEQQQEALWRIFLMFVAMALLIVRTGLVSRSTIAAFPPENAPHDVAPAIDQSSPRSSADLYKATLALLRLAEAAGRLFILNAHPVWELMNHPAAPACAGRALKHRQPVRTPAATPRHIVTFTRGQDCFRAIASKQFRSSERRRLAPERSAFQGKHMDALIKAVWYIESNFVREIDLDEIASAAGVSRFHLTRAFGQSFGRSAMRYMRGRRLSEAAKKLADGAPDILSVALDAGYASHEAFTRAFRDQFGITPEQYRAMPDKSSIDLVEAILVDQESPIKLAEPRIVDAEAQLFAGLGQRFEYDQMAGIPALWQRFNQHVGSIPGEVPGAAYGICTNADNSGLDYICAVEVKDFADVDRDFTRLRVPAQRYVVFAHKGPIIEIRTVIRAIWGNWLPSSAHETADGPSFERYGKEFEPLTGNGGFEIWVPIKN